MTIPDSFAADSGATPPTVLFVDDEPNILAGLKHALRHRNFAILTATSGRQALDVLARHKVDVVVSDERMPGMTGSELLGMVRESYPDTVRVILTGQASLDGAVRAINDSEVYRFLTKPCSPTDIAVTIEHALQPRRRHRSSTLAPTPVPSHSAAFRTLERRYPGISKIDRDTSGAIVLDAHLDGFEERDTELNRTPCWREE